MEGEGPSKNIAERSVGNVWEVADAHFSYINWYKWSAVVAQELYGFMEYLTGHMVTAKLSLRCKKKKKKCKYKWHLTKNFSKQDTTDYMEVRTKLKEN